MHLIRLCISCLIVNSNKQRWDAAVDTLKTTVTTRSKFDRRAKLASLVGIYMDDDEQGKSYGVDLIVAIQPDRSSCRKMIFMNRITGKLLGYILLETSKSLQQNSKSTQYDSANNDTYVSTFRGIEVQQDERGCGYSTLFMSLWLKLCLQGDVIPATVSINKPLLALTLSRFGFTPIDPKLNAEDKKPMNNNKKRKRVSVRKTPLLVEISRLCQGKVHVYCDETNFKNLQAGFTETELNSQNLVLVQKPTNPRGRKIQIRTHYAPPDSYENVALYGLRLDALQGECTSDDTCTPDRLTCGVGLDISEKVSKALTGHLRGFNE